FAVVGLTEKYGLFIEMLRKLLPTPDAETFWRDEAGRRENGNKCKHSTCAVLNALSADARRDRHTGRARHHIGDTPRQHRPDRRRRHVLTRPSPAMR
ncbi:MAG: hypothetical protein ACPGNP_02310, partial [Acidimicrobiales bacterium]